MGIRQEIFIACDVVDCAAKIDVVVRGWGTTLPRGWLRLCTDQVALGRHKREKLENFEEGVFLLCPKHCDSILGIDPQTIKYEDEEEKPGI